MGVRFVCEVVCVYVSVCETYVEAGRQVLDVCSLLSLWDHGIELRLSSCGLCAFTC